MPTEFETYIKAQADLSDRDIALILSLADKRTLKRKEFLLREGEVCRHKAFICKGLLRVYRTKADGSEHILKFPAENNWSVEPDSYDNATPSNYSIDALEDCEVLLWPKKDFNYLLDSVPALKLFSQRIISDNIYSTQQRVFSAISSTAEERYDEFIQAYPNIMARVPLHIVASYLGVTRETLSRIRNAQVKR